MIFHHPKAKTFCMASFLARKKKDTRNLAIVFFFLCLESLLYKHFCLRMMKNHQHQHKGKPHIQGKFQGAAISVEDVIRNSVHTSEPHLYVLEEPGEFHAQDPVGCHQERGESHPTKY
jgi:hypothetical protein